MKNVAIIGAGQTKFGEHWDLSVRDMLSEAGRETVKDAKIDRADIDSIYVGTMSSGRFSGQEHIGALAAEALGMTPVPSTRCEGACASGSVAFRAALNSIRSGDSEVALVLGVEKMTDVSTGSALTTLAAAGDQEWEAAAGLTFAGAYALMARRHMHDYGTTREQLALVSVNNHKNAVGNKYAQYPFAVTQEQVVGSVMISDPLRLLDCSPITDGAAGIIIASEDVVKNVDANPVWIKGSGQGSDALSLQERSSLTEIPATKYAAKRAFEQADISPKDVDVVEVHDCFSINEIISLEDLGFCKKGEGGKFVENGHIAKGGDVPTNTTGGLKAQGHPVGATGIRQLADLVRQLRGDSHNQINGARWGMNLNIGGSGATSVVNILSNEI